MNQNKPHIVGDMTEGMLAEASELAYDFWKDESDRGTPEQRFILYQYLVRYYFHPASPFRIAVTEDNGRLEAFLLAQAVSDHVSLGERFLEGISDGAVLSLLQDYKAYLDGNQRLEEAVATSSDVIVSLFVSCRHGCGRMLLEELQRRARQEHFTSMLLWTDDTCDWRYYPSHGFSLALECPIPHPFSPNMKRTLLYRKSLA